jgi:hypothetical protein
MPRWMTYVLTALIVVLVGIAITAPIGPMPGLRLGGSDSLAPDRQTAPGWKRLHDHQTFACASAIAPTTCARHV